MKRHLLGFFPIALFCSCPAYAQSSFIVSGTVDVNVQRISSEGTGDTWQASNSGLSTSNLSVRGMEDLGGNWKAGFWLETGQNPDNGTGRPTNTNNQPSGATTGGGLTFERRAYVTLAGPWGEVRLGRDFVPSQYTNIEFDAFNTNGVGRIGNFTYSTVGAGPLPTTIAASNTFGYWTPPSSSGFYARVMAGLGENSSAVANKDDGRFYGVGTGWKKGSYHLTGTYMRTEYLATAALGDYRQATAGFRWNGKLATLFALYSDVQVALASGDVRKGIWSLGAHVPVSGSSKIRLSYSTLNDHSDNRLRNANGTARSNNDAVQLAVGYVHTLSKRTALYGNYARIKNDGHAAYFVSGGGAPLPGKRSSGTEIGLNHRF